MGAVIENRTWREWGEYFGFPECCIQQFEKDFCAQVKRNYPNGPWLGTGYVPCDCCAPKAEPNFRAFVASVITPNRKCQMPFGAGAM